MTSAAATQMTNVALWSLPSPAPLVLLPPALEEALTSTPTPAEEEVLDVSFSWVAPPPVPSVVLLAPPAL